MLLIQGNKKLNSISIARDKMQTIGINALLIIMGILFLLPFYWLFTGALKTSSELFAAPPVWWPADPQLETFIEEVRRVNFFKHFGNTLFIVATTIIGSLLFDSMVAYGFSRIEWKYRDKVFMFVLATLMLPVPAIMVPRFVLFSKLGWLNTYAPLIVPRVLGLPFFIYLLRQFFRTIPFELSDAATVDGAGHWYIYSRIVLPLSKPALVTVGIYTFLQVWGDFLEPYLYISDQNLFTLSVKVQSLMSSLTPDYNRLLIVAACMTLPVLVVFIVVQKSFMRGIATTGLK
ncbi:MAG: carbohydrate ABC transporter permease [Spirochaetales bacterium]|nr:carbohydrate ABC transporter permease [Spirochaetales bacterium]